MRTEGSMHFSSLSPHPSVLVWWAGLDSNQRRRKPADLQSAPVVHFGTDPYSATGSSSGVHYTPPSQGCQIRNRMAMRFLDILIVSRLQWPLGRENRSFYWSSARGQRCFVASQGGMFDCTHRFDF